MLCFTCIVGWFSYTCIYFKFFSHLGYYRILSRVPCVISQNFETKCLLLVTYDCVCVLVAQLCPAICFPTDYSLPGSSVHRILQTRILEWVALWHMGSSWTRYQTHVPCIGRQILNHWTTREVPYDSLKQVVTPMKNKQKGGNYVWKSATEIEERKVNKGRWRISSTRWSIHRK